MLNKENHYEFAWNSTRVKELKSNIWQNPRHLDILKYEQGDQPKATSEVENKERIIANAVAQTVESSFVVEQLKNPQDSIDSLFDISENVNSDTDGALFQISQKADSIDSKIIDVLETIKSGPLTEAENRTIFIQQGQWSSTKDQSLQPVS